MSVHCTLLYFAVLVDSLFTEMAEVSKQYNLRSSKTDPVHLPVQLQFSDDSQFMTQLLKQQEHSVQVSDSNSSSSDLNCSDLVQSDDETNNTKNPNVSNVASDISKKQSTSVSQDTINAQILAQLQSIGQRLTKIESTQCKKSTDTAKFKSTSKKQKHKTSVTLPQAHEKLPTNVPKLNLVASQTLQSTSVRNSLAMPVASNVQDSGLNQFNDHFLASKNPVVQNTAIPHLHELRQDIYIQNQVEKRLKDLADSVKTGNSKQKSLRGGSVEVIVPNRVKWPHEYILSGSQKESVSYDQLSVTQWMAGFCHIMKEEQNSKNQKFMLDYLISLLDGVNDFSWDAAKASHAVLLCRMEQGKVVSYQEIDKIDRIRRANAQRHIPQSQYSGQSLNNVALPVL